MSTLIPLSGEMTIQVFNVAGIEVYTEQIKELSRTLNKQINISGLAKGIYHMQLQTKEGIAHRKVVIQ